MKITTAREQIDRMVVTYEADVARLTRQDAAHPSIDNKAELRRFQGYLAEMRFWAEVLEDGPEAVPEI